MWNFFQDFCTYFVLAQLLFWGGDIALRSNRDRWFRTIGFRARDALGDGMEAAGMPTCVRPASKRGKTVMVAIEGVRTREYPIDTTSSETIARDVSAAVEVERAGLRGG